MNPVNQEAVPIWVADYVLGSYGSGAIMAVPAHDTRDHAFAHQFGLPVRQVVQHPHPSQDQQLPYTGLSPHTPQYWAMSRTCLTSHLLYCRPASLTPKWITPCNLLGHLGSQPNKLSTPAIAQQGLG